MQVDFEPHTRTHTPALWPRTVTMPLDDRFSGDIPSTSVVGPVVGSGVTVRNVNYSQCTSKLNSYSLDKFLFLCLVPPKINNNNNNKVIVHYALVSSRLYYCSPSALTIQNTRITINIIASRTHPLHATPFTHHSPKIHLYAKHGH